MDRDDMSDDIKRANFILATGDKDAIPLDAGDRRWSPLGITPEQARNRVVGKHPSLAAPYGQDIRILAGGDPYKAMAEIVTGNGKSDDCPGCLEFGTICRPCRRARYEAGLAARLRAERRHHLSRVRVALIGGLGVLLFLIAAQCVLDRRCGEGHRWNTDTLACEPRR